MLRAPRYYEQQFICSDLQLLHSVFQVLHLSASNTLYFFLLFFLSFSFFSFFPPFSSLPFFFLPALKIFWDQWSRGPLYYPPLSISFLILARVMACFYRYLLNTQSRTQSKPVRRLGCERARSG